jgi:diaminopimelate decarboxylase
VLYALKANNNDRILSVIAQYDMGADCVSGPEVLKAIESGFSSDRIVLAGVGKTDEEIILALRNNIACLNVESLEELQVTEALARKEGLVARISLRINPGVEAHTHAFITTGLDENKFGLSFSDLEPALNILRSSNQLQLTGIHTHIGSQITRMDVFKTLCQRMNELNQWFCNHDMKPAHLNLGGGLGVDYKQPDENPIPDFETYFSLIRKEIAPQPGQEIWCEPGRSVVAQCGSLLTKVLFTKKREKRNFLIVDGGMTELIRPALYQAYHQIDNLSRPEENRTELYDVVGPVCESSDYLGIQVNLPESRRNDILAVRSAGAYGEAMSSGYNLRQKASVYFIE